MTTLPRAPRLLKGGIVLIDPETPAVRAIQNGIASETTAPQRIDCHYLITAWSPTVPGPAVEPAQDEHALLAQVTRVLMQNESLIPREAYASDPLLASFPPEIADAESPTSILPVEGIPISAKFWGPIAPNQHRELNRLSGGDAMRSSADQDIWLDDDNSSLTTAIWSSPRRPRHRAKHWRP